MGNRILITLMVIASCFFPVAAGELNTSQFGEYANLLETVAPPVVNKSKFSWRGVGFGMTEPQIRKILKDDPWGVLPGMDGGDGSWRGITFFKMAGIPCIAHFGFEENGKLSTINISTPMVTRISKEYVAENKPEYLKYFVHKQDIMNGLELIKNQLLIKYGKPITQLLVGKETQYKWLLPDVQVYFNYEETRETAWFNIYFKQTVSIGL